MITLITWTGAGTSPAPPVIAPEYEVMTVTVPSGGVQSSGKCTPGSVSVGHHPVGDVDKEIGTITIAAGSVKVKLTGKGEQDNTFNVILLKPVEEPTEEAAEEAAEETTEETTEDTPETE